MKRYLPYLLTGLAAWLVFLVATVPADKAWGLASSWLPKNVILKDLQGTLWKGRAGEGYFAGQRVSSLSWDLSVLPLLWGTVQADVTVRQGEGYFNGNVARSLGGDLTLQDVEARMKLEDLTFLGRTLPRGMDAVLNLQLQEVAVEDHLISSAEGVVALQDTRLGSGKGMELGDLRMDLVTEGGEIKGALKDGGGAGLEMDGVLTVSASDGAWNFSAYIAARDSTDPMIKQGLGMLGRPGADGRVNVSRQGKLSDIGGIFARPPAGAK